ncbi:uncharacterized protein K460DRAFT_157528 [Cucurbitaria berberidis CBS 394.84]|uniref:Uncharacterized protein n=1 Tax=Cucurbitaria berberidis CBS 394.84 TaxID=1168544 RepID=A0A9P4GDT0_9PLEO|nr:uncharacterized protein K460DRAFT_157528 [Cucurbitaria berberidis CBS 394.84]KAF1844093.1 hypothetical protein K460DRAFT_157528 [Cucurbitaria berberidis CBS 394.84]
MPLYLDPNACYRITSANRTGDLQGESASLNSLKSPANTLTALPNNNTPTLANISMMGPSAEKGQLWVFRWVADVQPNGFIWTLHNLHTGLTHCIERNADGTLNIGKLDSKAKDNQMWYFEIAPTGNAKWMMQDRQGQNFDVKKGSSQVKVLPSKEADGGEKTLWDFKFVRPATIGQNGELS